MSEEIEQGDVTIEEIVSIDEDEIDGIEDRLIAHLISNPSTTLRSMTEKFDTYNMKVQNIFNPQGLTKYRRELAYQLSVNTNTTSDVAHIADYFNLEQDTILKYIDNRQEDNGVNFDELDYVSVGYGKSDDEVYICKCGIYFEGNHGYISHCRYCDYTEYTKVSRSKASAFGIHNSEIDNIRTWESPEGLPEELEILFVDDSEESTDTQSEVDENENHIIPVDEVNNPTPFVNTNTYVSEIDSRQELVDLLNELYLKVESLEDELESVDDYDEIRVIEVEESQYDSVTLEQAIRKIREVGGKVILDGY